MANITPYNKAILLEVETLIGVAVGRLEEIEADPAFDEKERYHYFEMSKTHILTAKYHLNRVAIDFQDEAE